MRFKTFTFNEEDAMKKTQHHYTIPLILLGLCTILMCSCGSNSTGSSDSISDDFFYKELSYTITQCLVDIYNQNLAGKTVGTQNITAAGPMGGTVTITGSTGYASNNGITTTALNLALNTVTYTYIYTNSSNQTWTTEITLSGDISYNGSFSSTYTSVSHQSSNLYISGSVTHNSIIRPIDTTGVVTINRLTSRITSTICGYTVSW
jgi:hypothetical protein